MELIRALLFTENFAVAEKLFKTHAAEERHRMNDRSAQESYCELDMHQMCVLFMNSHLSRRSMMNSFFRALLAYVGAVKICTHQTRDFCYRLFPIVCAGSSL